MTLARELLVARLAFLAVTRAPAARFSSVTATFSMAAASKVLQESPLLKAVDCTSTIAGRSHPPRPRDETVNSTLDVDSIMHHQASVNQSFLSSSMQLMISMSSSVRLYVDSVLFSQAPRHLLEGGRQSHGLAAGAAWRRAFRARQGDQAADGETLNQRRGQWSTPWSQGSRPMRIDTRHTSGHAGARRRALAIMVLIAGCDGDSSRHTWSALGEVPAPAATGLNHTPLVVSGGRVLVGTADGIWTRALDGSDDWSASGLTGVSVFATRRHPELEATVFAAGLPVDDPGAPPFYRSDDGGNTWVASATYPRNVFDQSSEPFFDFVVAPDDSDRLYANLSGPSVAISTDGGQNWALANGETEVFFGDPCVIHVLASLPGRLYQGCEAPLDIAWVATQDIDPADPFALGNFTFVAGGPDFALENRRPNAMVSGPARPGTLYVGLEGALIALDNAGFEFVFRAEDGAIDPPYAYVGAIWTNPVDDDHLIFGGGINGENEVLSLFETRDHGRTIRRLRGPEALVDPAVEQLLPAGEDTLAVLVSHAESFGAEPRQLSLYLLELSGS